MAESAQGTQINTGQNPPKEVALLSLSHSPYDLYFQITLHTKPLFQIFISYVYFFPQIFSTFIIQVLHFTFAF